MRTYCIPIITLLHRSQNSKACPRLLRLLYNSTSKAFIQMIPQLPPGFQATMMK